MEEGLNSRKLLRSVKEDDDDEVRAEKEGNDGEKNLHSVSVSCKSEREVLEMEIEKGDGIKVEEVRKDSDLRNRGRKRKKVDSSVSKKVVGMVKEEIGDCKVLGGGRILRSRSAVKKECSSITDDEENNSNTVVQDCKSSRYGKKRVKFGRESSNLLLKRKRGRPPKVEDKDTNELVASPRKKLKGKLKRPPDSESGKSHLFVSESETKLKKKRGRPRKVELENGGSLFGGSESLKHKRGRPPKLQQSNGALRDKHIEGNKVRWAKKLDLKLRSRVKRDVPTDCLSSDKRRNRKELNVKKSLPVESDLSQENLEPKVPHTRSSKVSTCSTKIKKVEKVKKGGKHKNKNVEGSRSAVKNLLRERITEILLTAGWTIEYRPRFNREYHDAVYVSPEGRTHWSITLAYKVLKKHYEEGDGDSKVYKTGFVLTPIPEEELMILTRITVPGRKKGKLMRQRENGKLKKKGFIEKRKGKEKASSLRIPVSKSIKRKLKGNTTLHHERENSDHNLEKESQSSFRNPNKRKTQKRKRCALLVRNAEESVNSYNDGYILYNGKRTLLAWMIDLGILSLDEKVQYMNQRRTRVKLDGAIKRDGVHCNCCGEVITISKFEMHAGSRLDQPLENIYVQSGASLLQCLLESLNKQNEPQCGGYHLVDVDVEDPNDDTCGICGDGGDLICCDSCPSTFHQSCLDIKKFPSGHWHCLYCSCKSCGQVTTCLHLGDDDHEAAAAATALYTCRLCEEKYHPLCVRSNDASDDDVNSPLFCGKKCQMLYDGLQKLLGVKHDMEEGFSWTLVHRSDIGSDVSLCSEVSQKIKCNSKLAVALFVMDECFLPIIDHRSGINLLHNILYNCGSNFSRINYSGFYTAIFEKDDEVICAASLRIHGNELAEMPFIGTRYMYRRQGMCRRFLSAIETALSSLNVEKLVIPAISELIETWTNVFGFKPLEEASKKRMRNMNLLVFPGVDMLHKSLYKDHLQIEGSKSSQLAEHHILEVVSSSPEERCSPGSDLNACSKGTACDGNEIADELAVIGSSSKLNNEFLNNTSDSDNHANNVTADTKDIVDHSLEESNNSFENLSSSSCQTACGEAKEVGHDQNTAPGSSDPNEGTLVLNAQLKQDEALTIHQNSCPESPIRLSNEGTKNIDCQGTAEVGAPNDKLKSTNDGLVNQLGTISTHHPKETAFVPDGKTVCFSTEIANGCHATSQMDSKISSPSQGDRINANDCLC